MTPEEKEKLADDVQSIIGNLEPRHYHDVLTIVAFRRPWRPKRVGWVNVQDQFLHALYATLIFFPVVVWPSVLTAGLSGLVAAAIREWEQWKNQDLKILMFWDRLQDASFFAAGAVVVYFAARLFN